MRFACDTKLGGTDYTLEVGAALPRDLGWRSGPTGI